MVRYFVILFLVLVSFFIFLFGTAAMCIEAGYEAKKQEIISEIGINIPPKSTIVYTKVPRGIILSVAQAELFDDNGLFLTHNGKTLLDEIAKLLKTFNNNCTIEAHSDDNTANPHAVWEYSIIRANIVADYLVGKAGVDSSRLFPIGFGNIMPFRDNVSTYDFYDSRIDFVIFDYSTSR